jgi:RHS repeat-associated protein
MTRCVAGGRIVSSLDASGAARYYIYNGHGDVAGLTDASGALTKTYRYDAFGNEVSPVATDTNPFRYTGEYFDKETGDYYLRARYYDPLTGRFLSEDSYFKTHNQSNSSAPDISAIMQNGNLYVYCMNNPIRWIDPTGYITQEEQEMFEKGKMSPGAYTYLMLQTYNYYLATDDAGRDAAHKAAEDFRNTGYEDTGDAEFNRIINAMSSLPTEAITREQHFLRNDLNIEFTWDEFQTLNKNLPTNLQWKELPWYESLYHKFSLKATWQGNNRKYVSACEHFEAVYTKENFLVDAAFSKTYMGTYNYYGPRQAALHVRFDVDPYRELGNTP